MPVREGYEYADTAHEKTVQVAGWTYGCHSAKVGDALRGGPATYMVRDGYVKEARPVGKPPRFSDEKVETVAVLIPVVRPHTTQWLDKHADGSPLKCGHLEELRIKDPQCIGCTNRE